MKPADLKGKSINVHESLINLLTKNNALLNTNLDVLIDVLVLLDKKGKKEIIKKVNKRLSEHQDNALDLLLTHDDKEPE